MNAPCPPAQVSRWFLSLAWLWFLPLWIPKGPLLFCILAPAGGVPPRPLFSQKNPGTMARDVAECFGPTPVAANLQASKEARKRRHETCTLLLHGRASPFLYFSGNRFPISEQRTTSGKPYSCLRLPFRSRCCTTRPSTQSPRTPTTSAATKNSSDYERHVAVLPSLRSFRTFHTLQYTLTFLCNIYTNQLT